MTDKSCNYSIISVKLKQKACNFMHKLYQKNWAMKCCFSFEGYENIAFQKKKKAVMGTNQSVFSSSHSK